MSMNEKNTNTNVNRKPNRPDRNPSYGFYSRVLNKPFDSVAELKEAEAVYYADLKAKEDKASQKKADAQKVENAFKALNAARKAYKENLAQLTKEYSEALTELKKAFDVGTSDIKSALAAAEDTYSKALKEFTSKYDTYHLSLKDGDFETTISSSHNTVNNKKENANLFNLVDLLFNF